MRRLCSALVVALVLWTQPASAAIALVSRANTPTHATTTSLQSPAQTHTAGNLLVVVLEAQLQIGPTTITSVSDLSSGANTFTVTPSTPFNESGGANAFAIYYAKNITGVASNVITVALSGSTSYCTITVYEFSGIDTTSPFVADSSGTAASGTAIATGTITLTGSSVIVAVYQASAAPTAGTGYTQAQEDDNGFVFDSYHLTASSEAATATMGGSALWGILAAGFKAAGGAATAPCMRSLLGVGCH